MIKTLVLFGATGDLAGRYLLPALAALEAARELPHGFSVIGAAREQLDDETFRRHAADRLDRHAPNVSASARDRLIGALRYRAMDFSQPGGIGRIVGERSGGAPVAVYLALPPRIFRKAIEVLGEVGLPSGSRIVVEKPFGEDLETARSLNALLARVSGDAGERTSYRVDHVLGMASVQNLLGMRFANRMLEPLWRSDHIEQIDILWEETLGLEGRASFYDRTGALRDVMQNHMLQVLSLIAMEPPASLEERDVRDRKVELLRSVRTMRPSDIASRTRRARYTAGRLADGRLVPSYAEEHGVDPARRAETFAEVVLELDCERWSGTRFLLRAGKALARRRKEAILHFRRGPHDPIDNELRIGIDGPDDLALRLTGLALDTPAQPVPLTLISKPPASELPPYGRVLLDILSGESRLSIRGDEAEESWRIMDPIRRAWVEDLVPLSEYEAGSTGPPERA